MPTVEIVAVGTELLLGQLVDTNTPFIAARLADAGIDVFATHAVGDNRVRIAATIASALERADGVVTTGGLGPTIDDLTKEAVCDALSLETERHEPTIERMERFFASIGRPMRENNRKQADLPAGSVALENARGTAPGFIVETAHGKFVACVPGVPHEMRAMVTERLIPALRERFGNPDRIFTRVLHVTGLGESEIDHRIDDLFRSGENPKIAVLAHVGACDVKIMAKAPAEDLARAMIAPIEDEVRARLRGHVFGADGDTLAAQVLARCRERGWHLAAAESCTGGRVAALLTAVPGASEVFTASLVAYANAAKSALLGVEPALIEAQGAVSEAVARAMAAGARARFGADVAVATTGVAGPSGGSAEKPVGLVWIALDFRGGSQAMPMQFPGDREEIQIRAAQASLSLLWGILEDREGRSL